jgi:hypothetical protein
MVIHMQSPLQTHPLMYISLYPPLSSNSLPIPKGTSSVYIPQLALTSLINKTTIIKTQTTTANLKRQSHEIFDLLFFS